MLSISPKIVEHMTWHNSHDAMDWVLVHPSDGAWKYFNRMHPYLSMESRNAYFKLCTNWFNPFGLFITPYSYWLVIFIVYNLLPGMYIKLDFMFLSTDILGSYSPGWNINFYLWPLIDKLKQLWLSRTLTYNVSRKL